MTYDAILITGPTASGKSALALDWAKKTGGVVVNADSMQVYDTLRMLTARPSEAEMDGIPHLLYGHVPASKAHSTGAWLREIAALLDRLRPQGRVAVIVGGTGLYFRALLGGLSDMPSIPDDIRTALRARLAEDGPADLYNQLAAIDPVVAARIDPADGQRIVRALEVHAATGKPLSHFQGRSGPSLIQPGRVRKFVVLPDRAVLAERIDRRFAGMLETGAVEEVEALLVQNLAGDLPAMRAIGVLEIAAHLRGEMTRQDVIDRASAATRQYAKRQMTWFRNQMDESWERLSGQADLVPSA